MTSVPTLDKKVFGRQESTANWRLLISKSNRAPGSSTKCCKLVTILHCPQDAACRTLMGGSFQALASLTPHALGTAVLPRRSRPAKMFMHLWDRGPSRSAVKRPAIDPAELGPKKILACHPLPFQRPARRHNSEALLSILSILPFLLPFILLSRNAPPKLAGRSHTCVTPTTSSRPRQSST